MLKVITSWVLLLVVSVAVYFEAGVVLAIVVLLQWVMLSALLNQQERAVVSIALLTEAVRTLKEGKQ